MNRKDSFRYTKFDCVSNYYDQSPSNTYDTLVLEDGFTQEHVPMCANEEGVSGQYCRKWYTDEIVRLKKQGYTHNVEATEMTGGDNDFIVIDHKKKEYCFWENGFSPFCGSDEDFPQDKDLNYYAKHRR